MGKILVCKQNENLLLKKSKAFKYREIDLTALSCGASFDIEDKGDKLVGVSADEVDENPIYSIVTKEFGVYAKSAGVKSKIKVSFCDDGMMIVDVIEGGILIKPEEDVLLASRGVSEMPEVNLDNIYWVNADMLLSYKQYWSELKSIYTQDFEFIFKICGEVKNGLTSFGIQLIEEEVVDISGGEIAVLEAQIQQKEEAKRIKNGYNNIFGNTSKGYEFDDDDDEDEDEEDEDEDDDFDDGSNY